MVAAWAASNALCWRRSPPTRSRTKLPRAETAGDAAAERNDRDCRRAQLPARHRPADRRSGGDYALALKGNQERFMTTSCFFSTTPPARRSPPSRRRGRSWPHRNPYGHGRDRHRVLNKDHHWPGLAAVGKVERLRETAGKTTFQTAYYLLSAPLRPNASTKSSARIGASKIACTAARCRHERGSDRSRLETVPTISPFSATWPSTSCKRTVKKVHSGASSSEPVGTKPTSPGSCPCFEMQSPLCEHAPRMDVGRIMAFVPKFRKNSRISRCRRPVAHSLSSGGRASPCLRGRATGSASDRPIPIAA